MNNTKRIINKLRDNLTITKGVLPQLSRYLRGSINIKKPLAYRNKMENMGEALAHRLEGSKKFKRLKNIGREDIAQRMKQFPPPKGSNWRGL